MEPLVIGEKTARYPIIQGGMGVGISLHNLAGTVAKEGGIGIISTAQIGFQEPDFDQDPLSANLRAIGKELKMAREICPDGIIGFNIMAATNEYEKYVREAAAQKADVIISGAGLPTELPVFVEGTNVKIAPIVSTEKSAGVILKFWDKKYRRTADFIVIEGPKAGGHLGFHKDQIDFYSQEIYDKEIEKIIGVVGKYEEKYKCKIPVIVAGGITDKKDMERVKKLGADGIQVGSRFVATKECDADIRYKQSYVNAKKEDIVIVQSPVGMPGRAILNPFMKRIMSGERVSPSLCHRCLAKCNPSSIPYCITEALIKAAKGDVDHALLFCGADTYKINQISTVRDVIASFFL